ncbi:Argininosuccinate lyase [Cynara cardunculus var. scolymus]|uniref:Argininosuccinate lyase n=1 Tax=Cynara cardunculus var. scolymus TaxID=59895 RepID=A0A103YCV9_CYNCS|nr:Argininosuccinate lyase [Cynara cardunculus var. scolymus]
MLFASSSQSPSSSSALLSAQNPSSSSTAQILSLFFRCPLTSRSKRHPPPAVSCCASQQPNIVASAKEAKLWGWRFEEGVTVSVERFTESISFDKALYKHDIMGSRAHASMLAKQGLISFSDRNAILEGLDQIDKQIEKGEFVWRTDREDVHMNIEAALTDLIGEPAKKLHTARS